MKKIFILFVIAYTLVTSPLQANAGFNTPIYAYNDTSYNTYTSPLGISCYSNPTIANVGENIYWKASPYGGNGNYYVTWSGNDGLSGNGPSVTKVYNSAGTKNSSITVTSGNQTVSKNCSSVEIYDYNYNNNYNNNNYYNNSYYNSPLYVSCSANTTFVPVGTSVTWQATVSGGNGSYSYNWIGTDYLRGYTSYLSAIYNGGGTKNASVTVSSGNQTVTHICSNTVTVGVPIYTQYNNQYSQNYISNDGFQIACYPDKISTKIGVPVTWSVEAIAPFGSYGNLAYEWSGTDGLHSNQSSVIRTYESTGAKTANITVIAGNGQRVNQVCGNLVYVGSHTVYKASKNTNTNTNTNTNANSNSNANSNTAVAKNTDLSASSIFSLDNVPWGLVAIAAIMVMFSMIMYMLFNRKKI